MKKIFLIMLLSLISNYGYSTINSYEEEYLQEDAPTMDFHSFRDELNYLENETKNLDATLSKQNGVDTGVQAKSEDSNNNEDTISTTNSSVIRKPAIDEEIELKDLLSPTSSNKQRRIRSR